MNHWIRSNKGMVLAGIVSILGLVLFWKLLSGNGDGAGSSSATPESSATAGTDPGPRSLSERLAKRREAKEAGASDQSAALQEIFARWDEAKLNFTGLPLLEARREIAEDAVMRLGGSDGLLKFLDFLTKEGQGDLREWVIMDGMKELFESPEKSPAAREWLLGIKDLKLQSSLCFGAARGFKGPGFKEYIDGFESIHSQSRLLGGYFSEMAKTNPEGAVQDYFKTRPGKVDFTSLKHVMAAVPAGSDFIKISGMVPGDGPTLATEARKALLGAWAASAPQEAADYILSNSKLVKPFQLEAVIGAWMTTDPAAAAAWVESLDAGEHRDIAMASQSKELIAGDPAQAWSIAMAIPDTARREAAMKAVHREWMKVDPKTADAAWKTMRGQK